MSDTNDNTPEFDGTEARRKPKPPLPPPPGETPPPAPSMQRAPVPTYDPGPAPPKSPPLAAFLAILIPGLGHLYTWAYERAFMIWATIVGSMTVSPSVTRRTASASTAGWNMRSFNR
jgi:hypothetical protein